MVMESARRVIGSGEPVAAGDLRSHAPIPKYQRYWGLGVHERQGFWRGKCNR